MLPLCVLRYTSNYGMLAHDLAARHRGADGVVDFLDLRGNVYFPCGVRNEPPWGPLAGRPTVAADQAAARTAARFELLRQQPWRITPHDQLVPSWPLA